MYSVVYFCSESLLYLMGTVVHSGQVVQRSQEDKDPNDKSLRHFGAISDTKCSVEFAVTNRTPFDYFLNEKLKFALKNLTLSENKIQLHHFGDQGSDWVIFHWKRVKTKLFYQSYRRPSRLLFSVSTKLKLSTPAESKVGVCLSWMFLNHIQILINLYWYLYSCVSPSRIAGDSF